MGIVTRVTKPRFRFRRRRALVVISLAAMLAIGGAAVADVLVGRHLAQEVGARLSCRLGVDDARVSIGGWPRSMPLLTQDLPSVELRAENVEIAGVSSALDLTLRDVRDESGGALKTSGGSGTVTVLLSTVLAGLGDGLPSDLTVRGTGDKIVALLAGGAAELTLVPKVTDGRLSLRPDGLMVGGKEIEGALANKLIEQALTQTGSKAAGEVLDRGIEMPLPQGVSLRDVAVSQSALLLNVEVEPGDASHLLGRSENCA